MNKHIVSLGLIVAVSAFISADRLAADETAARTLKGHNAYVWSVAFSPDGKKVLSGSWDNTAKLWDVQTGKLQRKHTFSSFVNWVTFSPNGKSYLTMSSSVELWDARTGGLLREIKNADTGVPPMFSPQGEILAIGIGEGKIHLLNTKTDKAKLTLKSPDKQERIMSIAFSPDGKLVATGTAKLTYKKMFDPKGMAETGTVKLWNARTGKLLRTLKGHKSYVQSVDFAHDGKILASGSSDGTVKLWNANSGSLIRTLKSNLPLDGVFSVAFSPDDKILASGGASLRLWNPATGKLTNTLTGHSSNVHSVAFSPNGKLLASGSWDGTVKLWNISTSPTKARK